MPIMATCAPSGWDSSNICTTATQNHPQPIHERCVPIATGSPAATSIRLQWTSRRCFPPYSGSEAAGKIGGSVNYFKPTQTYYDEYIARVDHNFGANDHLFGHYYYDWFQQPAIYNPVMLSSYRSYFNTRYQNALLAETHTFTPNLLNNLVLNYQREVVPPWRPSGKPGHHLLRSARTSGSRRPAPIWPRASPAISASGPRRLQAGTATTTPSTTTCTG